MFKSVFSRIMATFTVILLLCILAVLLVVTSGLFKDSQEKKMSELTVAADEVSLLLTSLQSATSSSVESILKSGSFEENLKTIAEYNGANIVVVRSDGTVAASSEGDGENVKAFPPETVAAIAESMGGEQSSYAVGTLDGYLEQRRLNSFSRVDGKSGNLLYLVIVTGELAGQSAFAVQMTERTVVISIWVVFAAIVCVSFISRRITKPIQEIGNAAKEFANGNFNARVDVQGPDEIEELGNAFNHMAGSLAKHEENRNTFLSNVSHDLRTPMTTISGFVDGMLDGTIPPDQQAHYLSIISGEVRRLSRLVNTLLEVSRLESGRNMNMQDFNLTEKARQVVISLGGKIEDKKIEIDFDGDAEDLFVTADPDAIHQVLYNLIDNAVKFTDPGGTIGIRISETGSRGKERGREKDRGKPPEPREADPAAESKSGKAMVRIRNTGKGIPPEELEHIFERFYKSDRSRGLDKTGTGLGLYIVKTILEKHGETIHAESVADVYTEFRFTLSLAGSKKTREAASGPPEPTGSDEDVARELPPEENHNQERFLT